MPVNIIGQTLLNQFRVDAFIASGGMGAVYRVWDLKRNVPLAMKVLQGELADDPHIFKQFRREANALKKLTHPNIVQFYGLFQTPDLAFLLERHVDGPSLKDVLRQQGGKPLSIQETLVYLKALSSALGYAHSNGVVHCDVKPGNVLIDQGGNIYLTDFGIARHAESTTTTIATAGTAAYMAPEQVRGESVTAATDVYALGVMLFEMLTGQRPFRGMEAGLEQQGDTANERIRYAHLHLQPPDPRNLNRSISGELAQVILKALEKNPAQRHKSMQEFIASFYAATGAVVSQISERIIIPREFQEATSARETASDHRERPTSLPNISRKSVPWLIGGIIVALIAIVLISLVNSPPVPAKPPSSTTEPSMTVAVNTATIKQTATPRLTSSYQQGKIAFVMRNAANVYSLYSMNLVAGGELQLLLEPDRPKESRFYAPWFGSNGQMLAYEDFYLGKTFVMDLASPTSQRSLGTCASPSFAPDGKRLICSKKGLDYFPVFDVDSGTMVDKIHHGKSGAMLPAWSPDGSEIAFSILENNGVASIWKVAVSGGDPVPLATDATEDYAASWSPDSQWIAFQSTMTSDKSEIWVMHRDGSGKKQITKSGGEEHWSRGPCFSPDGQWLAFVSNQNKVGSDDFGDVFAISLLTGEQQQLTFTDGFVLDWRVTWGVNSPEENTTSTDTSRSSTATSPKDGAALVRIPAGEFLRGLSEEQVSQLLKMCPACKRSYIVDELPQRQIYLDEFWMDQAEVTNAQFARFVEETGYVTSAEQKIHKASYVFNLDIHDFNFNASADWKHPRGASSSVSGLDTTAVTQVSWEDADAYCRWAGRRLPTEAEWEKAARGTDGRMFVWGNEPPSSEFLNFNLTSVGPQTTGSYAAGESHYGLYDMAGNVWEWVADFYGEEYYQSASDHNPTGPAIGEGYVLRGGSWASEYKDMYLVTATSRLWNKTDVSSDVLGFRCATTSP